MSLHLTSPKCKRYDTIALVSFHATQSLITWRSQSKLITCDKKEERANRFIAELFSLFLLFSLEL